jgi:hypothetical protein
MHHSTSLILFLYLDLPKIPFARMRLLTLPDELLDEVLLMCFTSEPAPQASRQPY